MQVTFFQIHAMLKLINISVQIKSTLNSTHSLSRAESCTKAGFKNIQTVKRDWESNLSHWFTRECMKAEMSP